MKKKSYCIFIILCMTVFFTACSNTTKTNKTEVTNQISKNTEQNLSENIEELTEFNEENKETKNNLSEGVKTNILIAYFSYGENTELPENIDASSSASIQIWNGTTTGNTGILAHMIEEATGGEIFSIKTVNKYPPNYDETVKQGQEENKNNIRPELATHIESLDDYDTIFLGFPNWWYDMPMAMYSFLDEYDFGDKTIIPFCTSGGSGFSDTIQTIKTAEPNVAVLEGISIGASSATDAQKQVTEWLNELQILK